MTTKPPSPQIASGICISLLTSVAHERELLILGDWLEFASTPPDRLLLIIEDSDDLQDKLEKFSARYSVPLEVVATASPQEMKDREFYYLYRQFEVAGDDMCLLLKLDTIPYRDGHNTWLTDAIQDMRLNSCLFITGSTLPYREDIALRHPFKYLTQRASNNFMLISAPVWRKIQDQWESELRQKYGRFVVEATIEYHCKVNNAYGLRLQNTESFRVFHTNEWGPRIEKIRANFKAGYKIERYLSGFQDKDRRYYGMIRKNSCIKEARIQVGKWRRKILRNVHNN